MTRFFFAAFIALAVTATSMGTAAAGEPLPIGTKAERKAALKKFDKNGDGALQAAELEKIQAANPAMYRALGKLAVEQGLTGDGGGTWHISVGDELPSGVVEIFSAEPREGVKQGAKPAP